MDTHAKSGPIAAGEEPATRVTGLAKFAGVLLIISGLWDVLIGISAILADKIFVTTPQYVYYFDITGWGWVHLILGVLVAGTGFRRREGDDLGAHSRGGVGLGQPARQLCFHPPLPVLVDLGYRAGRADHLGPREPALGGGLTPPLVVRGLLLLTRVTRLRFGRLA